MSRKNSFGRELEVAIRAARSGGEKALRYFETNPAVRLKDDSSPVTDADVESEKAVLGVLLSEFPEDSTVGEENGMATRDPRRTWFIDPIDGTKGFIRGLPFWSVLIGLEAEGVVVAGVAHFPALGVTYFAAEGTGCFKNDQRIRASNTVSLDRSLLQIGGLGALMATEQAEALEALFRTVYLVRSIGDAMAGCLVLEGTCDLWIETGLKAYDLAPFPIMAREAGAVFSDWKGLPSLRSGNVAMGAPAVHGEFLELLSGR